MRFLCDVHISYKIVKHLKEIGLETYHVNSLPNKSETTDSDICNYADKHNLILITKDSDFKEFYFVRGKPKKVIRIMLGNISNVALISLLSQYIEAIKNFESRETFYLELGIDGLTVWN
jgi:predicted nuclease of predicted toxin-antitoxin system